MALLAGARPKVTRFAPAPTGFLHLGHVVAAAWVWHFARKLDLPVILRIEDHDRLRSRELYAQALIEDLAWLGFEAKKVEKQSDRLDRYASYLDALRQRQLVYPCLCSRRDLRERGLGSVYDGRCRQRVGAAELAAHSERLIVGSQEMVFFDLFRGWQRDKPSDSCGDFVLRDRNGHFSYHFANVVDDIEDGVDLVIRGMDLYESSGRQIYLARLLGRRVPPLYIHHPLLYSSEDPQQKLSKARGDSAVRELRRAGYRADDVLGMVEGCLPTI